MFLFQGQLLLTRLKQPHLLWLNHISITNDLLYIDRAVIKEAKSRNKNLALAWIDYKKAYDMVPHWWIIKRLDLFEVAENIKSLLVNSVENWKVCMFRKF